MVYLLVALGVAFGLSSTPCPACKASGKGKRRRGKDTPSSTYKSKSRVPNLVMGGPVDFIQSMEIVMRHIQDLHDQQAKHLEHSNKVDCLKPSCGREYVTSSGDYCPGLWYRSIPSWGCVTQENQL